MKVWARLFGMIDVEGEDVKNDCYTRAELSSAAVVTAETCIVLYPSEQAARAAKEIEGGIVLEITTESLRTEIKDQRPDDEIARGGKPEVYLCNGSNELAGPPAPRNAAVSIAPFSNLDDAAEEQLEKDLWLQQLTKELEIQWSY